MIHHYCLEAKPVSLNNAYVTGPKNRRFLSSDAAKYKDSLLSIFGATDLILNRNTPLYKSYCMRYIFYIPNDALFFKNGKFQKKDISNYVKLVEDSFFTYVGIDDSAVFDFSCHKRQSHDGIFRVLVLVSDSSSNLVTDDINGFYDIKIDFNNTTRISTIVSGKSRVYVESNLPTISVPE